MPFRPLLAALALLCAGCADAPPPPPDLADDPDAYVHDAHYRRGVLERDLLTWANGYAQLRLQHYAMPHPSWDTLPVRDPPSRALRVDEAGPLSALSVGDAAPLAPLRPPTTDADWIALGRRVFFEYPVAAEPGVEALWAAGEPLDGVGFVDDGGAWVGLRVFVDEGGATRLGFTCAQCHASVDPATGTVTGVRANRAMDLGALRAAQLEAAWSWLPELGGDVDPGAPGLGDVLPDGLVNPYAFPDLGGLVDQPYLHHNANWHHRGTATLAVRCETLFVTATREQQRIPRVLSWALATWFRSLPAPAPVDDVDPADAAAGAQVFDDAGCPACHTPPTYTSDRLVTLDEIGTDPAAGASPARFSGHYRIPSLRGVGGNAPYLHHGAFDTLEAMFDPDRTEPGHGFGLELDPAQRDDLLAFLRSI